MPTAIQQLTSTMIVVQKCNRFKSSINLRKLEVNPYQSPRETVNPENSQEKRKRGLRKFSPFIREIVSYVRAILGGFSLICLLYLIFWDPDYSPFMTFVVLPIVVVMGFVWGLIETFFLPRYSSKSEAPTSTER